MTIKTQYPVSTRNQQDFALASDIQEIRRQQASENPSIQRSAVFTSQLAREKTMQNLQGLETLRNKLI